MKIEIGAGTKGRPGYVHVDAVELEGIDVVDDGRTLEKFGGEVADEIYCHWFLEHLAWHEVAPTLSRWMEVLKPGGSIHVVTSNAEAHNRCLQEGQITWAEWSYLIFAVANRRGYNIWDVHKSAWNQDVLKDTLEEAGFEQVNVDARWDCRQADGSLKCPGLIGTAVKPVPTEARPSQIAEGAVRSAQPGQQPGAAQNARRGSRCIAGAWWRRNSG